MSIEILHNPYCSKSRATLALLESRGLQVTIIDYQKQPPSVAQLDAILHKLCMQPRELMRTAEPVYKDLHLDKPDLTREQLLQAMFENPVLIERPIVLANGKAAIGRPPEAVLGIL